MKFMFRTQEPSKHDSSFAQKPHKKRAFVRSLSLVACAIIAMTLLFVGGRVVAARASSASSAHTLTVQQNTSEEQNKAIVLCVEQQIFNQSKVELVGKYFSANYIQHDPTLPNGQAGVIDLVQRWNALSPRPVIVVKQILADGDLVAVHSQLTATPSNEFTGQAVLDLYRLDKGIIVEHWDIIQDVPATSANGNSMFSNLYQYQGQPPTISEQQEAQNKTMMLSLMNQLFNGRDPGVEDQYWEANYIQHNPLIANGVAGFKAIFPYIDPVGTVFQFDYAVADGDLVLLYDHVLPPGANPNDQFTGTAVADMFRIVNGKVVEHWDVIQTVLATSVSGNSMFSSLYQAA